MNSNHEQEAAPAQPAAPQGAAYADAHGAIMGVAYDFRDAHISGSPNQKRSAHAALESAVTHALRASHGQAPSTQQAGWKLVPMVPTAAMVDAGCPVDEMVDHFDMATAYRSMLAAAPQHSPTAQAAPAGADVRRSDLVPGVMHCAKCKFQLNRVTLCVSDGNAYAGDNKTEPCPNGCGPLWPVTWEQEARNCWKTLEEMHERLQAAPAAGITLEQVEDAIGLQSAAWDTIGAEKIVEAVLRLANGQAPDTQQVGVVRKIDRGFRWDGENLQHVPTLLLEFEPVPANSPCDAKGWQDRDAVARSVALGQPMGNGQDQAAGHLGAQGDKLLTVAERNIRSFLRSAVFKSESDREAALNCVDVLWEAARAPADSVPASVDGPTRWFTVVYRDISAGDEARLLGEHPKASAMSWSHAIRDRDAARKQGGAA